MITYRNLALDVYRYYTRDYKDLNAQAKKMHRKYGRLVWINAVIIGMGAVLENRDQCAAVVVAMIEDALSNRLPVQ